MKALLPKAEHKLQQLNEACNLLEDLEWRLCWALDFSKYDSINEVLNPLSQQVSDALEEMEEEKNRLEEQIEEYKTDKMIAEDQFDQSSELAYCLN